MQVEHIPVIFLKGETITDVFSTRFVLENQVWRPVDSCEFDLTEDADYVVFEFPSECLGVDVDLGPGHTIFAFHDKFAPMQICKRPRRHAEAIPQHVG